MADKYQRRELQTPYPRRQETRGAHLPSGSREQQHDQQDLSRESQEAQRRSSASESSVQGVVDALAAWRDVTYADLSLPGAVATDYMEPHQRRHDVDAWSSNVQSVNELPAPTQDSNASSNIYIPSDPAFSGDRELSDMTSMVESDSNQSSSLSHVTFQGDAATRMRTRLSPRHGRIWLDPRDDVWRRPDHSTVYEDLDVSRPTEFGGGPNVWRDDAMPDAFDARAVYGTGTGTCTYSALQAWVVNCTVTLD